MKNKCTNEDTGKLLHAYELNLLSDNDKDLFEAHILECEYCFNELREFAPGGVLLRTAKDPKTGLSELSIPDDEKKSIWSRLWPKKPVLFRPALLYFLIVVMIWPSVTGLKSFFDSDRAGSNITAVQKISLSNLRYDQKTVFEKDLNLDGIIVVNCPAIDSAEKYQIQVLDEKNGVLYNNVDCSDFDNYKNTELIFPKELMRVGNYSVVVSKSGDEVCRYEFGIE